MNLSNLNLDAKTYTDAHLQRNFGLDDNYTPEDVTRATARLVKVASESLSRNEEVAFNEFLNAAKERLLKKIMVQSPSAAWTNNVGHMDTKYLLPSERELTVIPEQITQIQTRSQGTGVVVASVQQPQPAPTSGQTSRPVSQPSGDNENMVIPLPVPPQPHTDTWKQQTNPKNITSRIVLIDSQYRQNISTTPGAYEAGDPKNPNPAFNTDFTLDLSEPLKNVVSLKLFSVQIPTTWYTFDHHLGNTVFGDGDNAKRITPGNYNINRDSSSSTITFDIETKSEVLGPWGINEKTMKVVTIVNDVKFYQEGGFTVPNTGITGGQYINQNLGWNLGFRKEEKMDGTADFLNELGDVPIDLYGPKYFTLAVDDFNTNHHNKGLVTFSDTFRTKTITKKTSSGAKSEKTLTKAQKYSNNQKIDGVYTDENNEKKRGPGPRGKTDAFAIIPLKGITQLRERNEPFIDNDTALQSNLRTYSSPVDIERLRVRLFDDKGNLVNLHDNDWSFSLIVEQVD